MLWPCWCFERPENCDIVQGRPGFEDCLKLAVQESRCSCPQARQRFQIKFGEDDDSCHVTVIEHDDVTTDYPILPSGAT